MHSFPAKCGKRLERWLSFGKGLNLHHLSKIQLIHERLLPKIGHQDSLEVGVEEDSVILGALLAPDVPLGDLFAIIDCRN